LANCKQLTRISFKNIRDFTFGGYILTHTTQLSYIVLPNFKAGLSDSGTYAFDGCTPRGVYLGKYVTDIGYMSMNFNHAAFMIIDTPIVIKAGDVGGGSAPFSVTKVRAYVRDNLVEYYKTADKWNTSPDRIFPISQYEMDFPEDPKISDFISW